jgi:hypothetical protein
VEEVFEKAAIIAYTEDSVNVIKKHMVVMRGE